MAGGRWGGDWGGRVKGGRLPLCFVILQAIFILAASHAACSKQFGVWSVVNRTHTQITICVYLHTHILNARDHKYVCLSRSFFCVRHFVYFSHVTVKIVCILFCAGIVISLPRPELGVGLGLGLGRRLNLGKTCARLNKANEAIVMMMKMPMRDRKREREGDGDDELELSLLLNKLK